MTLREKVRRAACVGKVAVENEDVIRRKAVEHSVRSKRVIAFYRCPWCKAFHLTSKVSDVPGVYQGMRLPDRGRVG